MIEAVKCLLVEDLTLYVGMPESLLPTLLERDVLRGFGSVVREVRFC